jgi:hypothetical protein
MGAPPPGNADKSKTIKLEVTLGSPKDLPLLYAHQFLVNFTGIEFYVTVYRVAPEPWTAGNTPSAKVEGQPIARFAFSPQAWMASVQSFSDQIDKLHAEGNISDEQLDAVKRALAQ